MDFNITSGRKQNSRKFPKMRGPRPDHTEAKRAEAIERQKERAGRTAEQQIARLDEFLGRGKGAVKERTRLTAKPVAQPSKATKKEARHGA
jgi:hypothetical protein